MAAPCTAALVTPLHYHPGFKVDVRLTEPLLSGGQTPGAAELDMLALCAQLDLLCKQELFKHPSHTIEHGKTTSTFVNKASVIYDRMQQLLMKMPHPTTVQAYLEAKGFHSLYPRAAAYVTGPDTLTLSAKKSSTDNYFSQVAALHQICSLARQIHSDISTLPRPKYIAHQLALLYQSINGLQNNSVFARQKSDIENNFKNVKAIFSQDDFTELPADYKEWFLTLTHDIVSIVESFPAQLTDTMALPGYVLSQAQKAAA